jgi:hypothetical protein
MAMDPTDAAAANALANMKNARDTGHNSKDVNALMNLSKGNDDARAARALVAMSKEDPDATEDEMTGLPVRRGGKNRKSRKGRKSKKSRKSRKSTRRSSGRR